MNKLFSNEKCYRLLRASERDKQMRVHVHIHSSFASFYSIKRIILFPHQTRYIYMRLSFSCDSLPNDAIHLDTETEIMLFFLSPIHSLHEVNTRRQRRPLQDSLSLHLYKLI